MKQPEEDLTSHPDFEGGRKGPRTEECRQPPEAGKDKEMKYPRETLGVQPCQHLDFSQVKPILEFCPQDCKLVNVYYFKPRSLW